MEQNLKTVRIKNKDYVEVNTRILYFRENYPDHSIKTEIVELTDTRIVMRAIVMNSSGVIVSTGTAYEEKDSSLINKTSFVENCETSAIGRALGIMGIGISNSIASKEEVESTILPNIKYATEKQLKLIFQLAHKVGINDNELQTLFKSKVGKSNSKDISTKEANLIIEELQRKSA